MTSQLAPKILLLLILFCSCASPALSVDRIYQSGASLTSSHTLLSNNANFTLGFQRIGTEQSNASYLGIWYNAGRYQGRPFWLANPNNPIPDDSGALAIDASGNFKLTSSAGHVLTIYSSQSSTTNLTAVLQDSGNLILKEADSPDDKFLWQSFDFPTDSLLPGMKLGINHRTGETWSLNSWLTESVPSSGAFNLQWDSNEHQLVIKRRGTIFWTSGPLTSNDSFEAFSMTSDPLRYSFINVSNADEDYFMFTVAPYFSMWTLREDGGISLESSGRTVGGSICDGNSAELGCNKWEGPQCRNDGDKFVQRSGYFGGSVPWRDDDNSSLSKSDCKDMCWKDCRCVGIPLEYNANNTGCRFYYGDITPDPTGTFNMRYYVIVQESPPERNWIWILIAVALVVITALGSILFCLRRKRIRDKLLNDLLAMDDTTNDLQEFENDGNNGHNLKLYSVAAIMAATNSFSLKNKLGQGGFGPVYKGKLPEGREIAVKRLSRSSGQGLVEFKNELILIAKLQHRNLVRLLGFCIHGEEKMLVYEYMPNKSLDSFIFDSSKSGLIDWKRRFEIIEGIAQGMLYLHKYSRLRIIHRDLKASNILLDQDLNPKVSDFGMARIFQINQIESNTNRIVGTYGYMSPEYAMEGVFSVKSDVFSFGVLLLEIVSGRKNHGFLQMDRPLNLIGNAWELWREGNPLKLVDPTLRDSLYSKEEVLRCIKLGLLCVEHNPSDRPTMSDVVTMLASEAAQLPAPKQPAFSNARCILDENSSFVKQETNSINTYSTSTLEAR